MNSPVVPSSPPQPELSRPWSQPSQANGIRMKEAVTKLRRVDVNVNLDEHLEAKSKSPARAPIPGEGSKQKRKKRPRGGKVGDDSCKSSYLGRRQQIPELETTDNYAKYPFRCSYCDKTFRKSCHLGQHFRSHTKEKPWKCEQCPKAYATNSALRKHGQTHLPLSARPMYSCEQCQKAFRTPEGLRLHQERKHSTMPFKYECEYCSKGFYDKGGLRDHITAHTKEKPYQCKHCGKFFANRSFRTQHERSHSGEKWYQCEVCPAKFWSASAFCHHKMKHSAEGGKPYKCQHCNKAYVYQSALKYHNAHKHPVESNANQNDWVQCPMCDKRLYKADLRPHLATHTDEKPYQCQVCPKTYRQSAQLKKHMKSHARASNNTSN